MWAGCDLWMRWENGEQYQFLMWGPCWLLKWLEFLFMTQPARGGNQAQGLIFFFLDCCNLEVKYIYHILQVSKQEQCPKQTAHTSELESIASSWSCWNGHECWELNWELCHLKMFQDLQAVRPTGLDTGTWLGRFSLQSHAFTMSLLPPSFARSGGRRRAGPECIRAVGKH